jgi:hypothetical protein
MLLAAILTFGHALYVAQGLQEAADLAAREISRTPLPADSDFETLLDDGEFDGIYSKNFLVYDLDNLGSQNFFVDVVPTWPLLNQRLAPMMIVDSGFIRYPGALLTDPATPTGYTVGIPLLTTQAVAGGGASIRWVSVVEEIDTEDEPDDDSGVNPDPFRVTAPSGGIVAIRINYPFQSASMSSFQPNAEGPFEPTIGQPNPAVTIANELNTAPGGLIESPLINGEIYAGTYGGKYGLGAQGAHGQIVRPYRRVISAQAIYRREIFR